MSPEDAEEYTQALGQVVAGGWRQVALGQRLGVPDALGISTTAWVEDRLGGYVRLSITERREAVKELTAPAEDGGAGLSGRIAAEVLGIDERTVRRDLQGAANAAPEVSSADQSDELGAALAAPDSGPSGPETEQDAAVLEWATSTEPDDGPERVKYHLAELQMLGMHLDKLPAADRGKARKLIDEPGIPATRGIAMVKNLAELSTERRARVFELMESPDPRENMLAKTIAAEMPPMPDPRITRLNAAIGELRACIKPFQTDPLSPVFSDEVKHLSTLLKNVRALQKATLEAELHV